MALLMMRVLQRATRTTIATPRIASMGSSSVDKVSELYSNFEAIKQLDSSQFHFPSARPREVFANSPVRLDEIDVVGFDYDYTLCRYTLHLQNFIYDKAREYMVSQLRYPSELLRFSSFDPDFAIRGLTFDRRTGLLLKINFLHNITMSAAYRGRKQLAKHEILACYGGQAHISADYRLQHQRDIVDLFSFSEACLLADIVEFFEQHSITYNPASVHDDLLKAVSHVHGSGIMHQAIMDDLPLFLERSTRLPSLLRSLRHQGKKLFLLSNSAFPFIDRGMSFLADSSWRELFDVVIVSAEKPRFYTSNSPFRAMDSSNERVRWDSVNAFHPGGVYVQGSLAEFNRLTGFDGQRVLYFGDHLYTDLMEPTRMLGWTTAAIIRELDKEVRVLSTPEYQHAVVQLQALEELMRAVQDPALGVAAADGLSLDRLERERAAIRVRMGRMFNGHFGSMFRTNNNPTLFAYNVQRYVDLYTSRLENFLEYPSNYRFYPQRKRLPHEMRTPHETIRALLHPPPAHQQSTAW